MLFSVTVSDINTIGPIGGSAALILVMLRMVWSDRAAARLIEGKLRAEWAKDREQLIAYHEATVQRLREEYAERLAGFKSLHDAEIASLQRRIEALEADIARLRGVS